MSTGDREHVRVRPSFFVDTRRDYTLYVSGPIVAVVWRGELTEAAVSHVERVLVRTAEQSAEAIAFVTIASFRAPIPSQEIRTRIVECYRALGPRLHAVAQVVEGEGFWAAAARCVMAGIGLLSRGQHRMSVFGTPRDALVWLGGQTGVAELAAAMAQHQFTVKALAS
jgi:hypothetical protein